MPGPWVVLLGRAEVEVDRARQRLTDMFAQKAQGLENKDQLDSMMERYLDELGASQRTPHLSSQHEFYRRFIGQIQVLQKQMMRDLALIDHELEQARIGYEKAELERYRMKCLVDRECAIAAAAERRHEQKRMDEQGVLSHSHALRKTRMA